MATKMENLEIACVLKDVDIDDIDAIKRAISDFISTPDFTEALQSMAVTAKHSKATPIPRGGFLTGEASCSVKEGKVSCEGKVSGGISFP